MDVTPVTANAPIAPSAPTGQAAQSGSALSSDFETFLRMLTVQIQNQDPLSPMKSEDFAMQLATFSGVEQQVRTNELLESLGSGLGAADIAGYAEWVGQEVLAPLPVRFDGAPVTVYPPASAGTGAAQLVVSDAFGREVTRVPVELEGEPIAWSGLDANGAPLLPGSYELAIERDDTPDAGPYPVSSYAPVSEVRIDAGEVLLRTDEGIEIAATDIIGLRQPTAAP